MRRLFLHIVALLCFTLGLNAQLVYHCDFESDSLRQLWTLNPGANSALIERAENKWYIAGDANHTDGGRYGLMLADNEYEATYTNSKALVMFATCPVKLQPGYFTIEFDWVGGSNSLQGEGIQVFLVPDYDTSIKVNSGGSVMPSWASLTGDYAVTNTTLGSASSWKHFQRTGLHIPLNVYSDYNYHIVVAWVQSAMSAVYPPSGCVDNILIHDESRGCSAPTDITPRITSAGLEISWKGSASYYDILIYDDIKDKWTNITGVTGKKYTITGINEGVQSIYIRSHCKTQYEDIVSPYVFLQPFYYEKGRRCMDYLALDDKQYAACYYSAGYTEPYSLSRQNLTYTDLMHGSEYDDSHLFSLHYLADERDPWTEHQLLTKPKGAIASVRMGRKEPSFSAQVEHKYVVPEGDNGILVLRYALVLENPHPDDENMPNPIFTLQILADGKPLDFGCGEASFMSGAELGDGWNLAYNGAICWKDWSEVAVNLRDYVGKTITVRLFIRGCSYGAHGGYVYYTLDCQSGLIEGINCGDVPTTQFSAPSGFNYHWYLANNPDSILPNSSSQVFQVDPMDTLLYNVDVISKTNENCYYTLDATAIPRYPVAEATFEKDDEMVCENVVIFHQTSHVKYKNQVTEREWHTDLPVESIVWDFGDGSEPLETMTEYVSHTFPREGGSYQVTMSVGIADDMCVVPLTMNVELPDVELKPVYVHVDKCDGDYFVHDGRYYFNTYIDTLYFSSGKGCDSVVYMDIIFHPTEFTAQDSVCEGTPYIFGGDTLTESGVHKHTFTNMYGCDSIVSLSLKVIPALIVDFADTVYICADASRWLEIPYDVVQGSLNGITIRFDEYAQRAGMNASYYFEPDEPIEIYIPAQVDPSNLHANIEYGTPTCSVPEKVLCVQVRYPSSIIYQQDGMLSVVNSTHNGGYRFSGYQWYHNGQPMGEHTEPYLAVTDDEFGDEFYVELLDENGNVVPSCPISYGTTDLEYLVTDNIYPCDAYTLLGSYVRAMETIDDLVKLPRGVYILVHADETVKIVK